jgi:hypothetical protein
LDVLEWAHEHGCPWDEETCRAAAQGGHLDVLKWAREHGCPWNANTCRDAAEGGYLDVLKWAREHGCPWNGFTCYDAARHGHLETLKWAYEHGCPWYVWTCRAAAAGGHLDVLKWADAQGCPCDYVQVAEDAFVEGHLHVVRWAHEVKGVATAACGYEYDRDYVSRKCKARGGCPMRSDCPCKAPGGCPARGKCVLLQAYARAHSLCPRGGGCVLQQLARREFGEVDWQALAQAITVSRDASFLVAALPYLRAAWVISRAVKRAFYAADNQYWARRMEKEHGRMAGVLGNRKRPEA